MSFINIVAAHPFTYLIIVGLVALFTWTFVAWKQDRVSINTAVAILGMCPILFVVMTVIAYREATTVDCVKQRAEQGGGLCISDNS